MSTIEKRTALERQLFEYPPSLSPSEVAEILGIARKTADKLIEQGKIDSFVLDKEAQRLRRRVTKSVLIDYMVGNDQ